MPLYKINIQEGNAKVQKYKWMEQSTLNNLKGITNRKMQ